MLKKINRKICLRRYPKLPQSDNLKETFIFPKVYKGYILTLSSKSIKGHARNFAIEIVDLMEHLEVGSLVFLGDTETPWLFQQNDYPKAREALEYLSEKKVGKKFNGGFIIDTTGNGLRQFLTHLFWLVRCNASLPIVHFTDNDQHFIGSICKYGNLHFFILDRNQDSLIKEVLKKSHFSIFQEEKCSDPFSKTRRLKGRQTIR